MKQFLLRLAFLACVLFTGSGCVLTSASWMPDSSGFLFVRTDDSGTQTIHHYDISKKAHKQVAVVKEEIVSDPALHPKGGSFWLTTRVKDGHVVSIFDIDGEVQHRSGVLDLKSGQANLVLHWCPKGERLWMGMDHEHAFYDWRDNRRLALARYRDSPSAVCACWSTQIVQRSA